MDRTSSYAAVLDEVHVVTQSYAPANTIIWLGDINASFFRHRKTSNDRKMLEFCKEIGFKPPSCTPSVPTYHHFAGQVKSQIDYFLQLASQKGVIKRMVTSERHPLNCSSHDSITATLDAIPVPKLKPQSSGKPIALKPKWNKIDQKLYRDLTRERLYCLEETLGSPLPANVLIQRVHDILLSSARDATTAPPPSRVKRDKPSWPSSIKPRIQDSKAAHKEWVVQPTEENYKRKKEANKQLRSAQRRVVALRRADHIHDIIAAANENSSSLFRLVKPNQAQTPELIIDFSSVSPEEPVDQLEGWRRYLQKLATPQDDPNFNPQYKRTATFKHLLIQQIESKHAETPVIEFSQIQKLISSLKANKAADVYGIVPEHIKLADPIVAHLLTRFVQQSYSTRQFPSTMKLGAVTPVVKKGKPQLQPDSYRRITVTPVTGKLIEKTMLLDARPTLDAKQHKLQRGFSSGASSTNAAFIISEAISEAKDNKHSLFLQFLDARKAFDVVWHTGLLCSLHDQGVTGPVWELFNHLYTDISSAVKWQGHLSKEFYDLQGLRQGGDTSADAFKGKTNPVLNNLEATGEGFYIGTTPVCAPTCADDTTIISATVTGANILLAVAEMDANNERYTFSAAKSKIMVANPTPSVHSQLSICHPNLYNEPLPLTTEETHLGIQRVPDNKARVTVEGRIKSSRRALYAMMGAGLYGLNGLNPVVSKRLIDIYILPRLLHTLEAMTLSDPDIQLLEASYRTMLRQIQHLPKSSAKPAIYLLVGALPVEGHIHLRILSLLHRMISQPTTAEYEIVVRQLAMKDLASHSWVSMVRKVLHKYSLPSAYKLLQEPRKKGQWKRQCKEAVNSFWTRKLQTEATSYSTLKYLCIDNCSTTTPHHSYLLPNADPLLVTMAAVKNKVLIQRYPITASHTSGKHKTKTCPFCFQEEEDLQHFLFDCHATHSQADTYIEQIQAVLENHSLLIPKFSKHSKDWYTQLLLDPRVLTHDPQVYSSIESIARQWIFKLHHRRATAVGGGSRYVWARSRGNKLG